MTRKRISHAQIPNESKKNATFGRRVDGFLKKANEYSTLCGVDMGIIIHKQEGKENNAIMWPSPEIFGERLQKFLDFPKMERTRKMVPHEKFIEQIIAAETDSLLKSKEIVQQKESHHLMNQVMQGRCIDEFDLHELNCLNILSVQMLERLEKRESELNNEQLPMGNIEPSTLEFGPMGTKMSPSASVMLDNLMNDEWFIESMSEERDITDFFGVTSNSGGAASLTG